MIITMQTCNITVDYIQWTRTHKLQLINQKGKCNLTSGVVLSLIDLRSTTGFEITEPGERSTETRELCRGEGDPLSDFTTPLLILVALGVAGDTLLMGVPLDTLSLGDTLDTLLFGVGVSNNVDLLKFNLSCPRHIYR